MLTADREKNAWKALAAGGENRALAVAALELVAVNSDFCHGLPGTTRMS